MKSPSIASLSSVIADTGRRGTPKRGCDCMECFGYCVFDADTAVRQRALAHDLGGNRRPVNPLEDER